MKKIFDFSTHSEFDQSFEQLKNNVEFQRLNDKFKVKPFYLKYKGLKTFLNGFSYFIQLITVTVSFVCVAALLVPMMNIYLAYGIAVLSLIGIEFLKRLTFKPTVKEFLQFQKVALFSLFLSLSMLSVSLWLTWNGGKETIFLLSDAPDLLNVDSLTGYEKTRINELTAQLTEIKKNAIMERGINSQRSNLIQPCDVSNRKATKQVRRQRNGFNNKERKDHHRPPEQDHRQS